MGNSGSHQPLLDEEEQRRTVEEEGVPSDEDVESEEDEMWEAASWSEFLQKPFPGVRSCTPDVAERSQPSVTDTNEPWASPERSSGSSAERSRTGEALPLTPCNTIRKWSDDALVHFEAVKQYAPELSTRKFYHNQSEPPNSPK